MNIEQIYDEQKEFFEDRISDLYNDYVSKIDDDDDYHLGDDEVSELFNEIVLKYMRNTMSKYEWDRIISELK